jgi:hypothetical protein
MVLYEFRGVDNAFCPELVEGPVLRASTEQFDLSSLSKVSAECPCRRTCPELAEGLEPD